MLSEFSIHRQLQAQAERSPNSIALLSPGRKPLRYGDLQIHLEQMIRELNALGIFPNDRIAIVLPNGPEMALCIIAVSACATSVPLNPAYRAAEFDHYLASLNVKALITQTNLDSEARTAAIERGLPVINLIPLDARESGLFRLQADRTPHAIRKTVTKPEDVAVILNTSGTTGLPKIVPLRHANICCSAKDIGQVLRLVENDRCLNVMPLFHTHGLIIAVISSLLAGSSVVCAPGLNLEEFFEWMDNFEPTWLTAAPTIHQAILENSIQHRPVIKRSVLRFIRSSAAPLPKRVAEELEKVFQVPVIESFGMTECVQITSNPLPPRPRRLGSVGIPAGPEVAIMDGFNKLLPAGETGEIVIRGNNVIRDYGNEAISNDRSLETEWFRTGDQGFLDSDGYLYITGRLKEMINCGGEKISPREIDEVLLNHPAVAQAVTFAIPHPTLGEDIATAVVLANNGSVTEKELREFVSRQLADFKIPRQFLFVDEIPKGPTGKHQRLDLAKRWALTGSDSQEIKLDKKPEPGPITMEALGKMWSELLGIEPVRHDDNFFRLGGDSIRATQLLSKIRKLFQVNLPLRDIFHGPTLSELFDQIQRKLPRPVHPSVRASSFEPVRDGGTAAEKGKNISKRVLPELDFQRKQDITPAEKSLQFSIFFFSADGSSSMNNKYRLLLESTKFADKHGYTAVWTPERHFSSFGGLYPNPSVIGAALAAITERIQIRAGSVVLPLHDPIRVAEEWSVVDNLSHGRVGIAVASGWHANDFALSPNDYVDRKKLMFEKLAIIQKLWKGEALIVRNGLGKEIQTNIFPNPIQRTLPIWLASHSDESFLKAGEIGANVLTTLWNSNTSVENIARQIILYRKTLSQYGHDPDQGTVTLMLHTFVGDSMDMVREKVESAYSEYISVNLRLQESQADALDLSLALSEQDQNLVITNATRRMIDSRGLIGTLSECEARIDQLRSIGVNEIACLIDFGIDFDSVMASLHHLNRLKEICSNNRRVGGPVPSPNVLKKNPMSSSDSDNLITSGNTGALRLDLDKESMSVSRQAIPPRTGGDSAPLSFAQQRLWFLDQLDPNRSVYNLAKAYRLNGNIKVDALQKALDILVSRHEPLRTTFDSVDGVPFQRIGDPKQVDLKVVDLTPLSEPDRDLQLTELLRQEAARPFNLSRDPMIRPTLIHLTSQEHALLLVLHHIATDGWSNGILLRELGTLYGALLSGQPVSLPPLPIQYVDFAVWQRQWLQGEKAEKQLSYWKKQLDDAVFTLEFPTDRPRPPVQTYNGANESLVLPQALTTALKAFSTSERVTLFMTLLAAFKTLLYRYTAQEDVLIGMAVAGRNRSEIESLVGFFINTLVLRTNLSAKLTFRQLLSRVREGALEAYENQDLPFEKLVEELQPKRDLSHTPLFQVFVNHLNLAESPLVLPGLTSKRLELNLASAKFDMTLYFLEEQQTQKVKLNYNTDLFEASTIQRILCHFKTLLEAIVENPEQSISSLPLLTEEERIQRSVRMNRVKPDSAYRPFQAEEILQPISDCFLKQVEKYPERIAIKSTGGQLSYRELNNRTNAVADAILSVRDTSEERISLLFEHDIATSVGILSALKSGKTYVPLDPKYPEERLKYILHDSQSALILTNDRNLGLASRLATNGVPILNIDNIPSCKSQENVITHASASSLAYILYTSGSTGKPKGVVQNHRNVLHFIRAYTNNLHITSEDKLTLFSSYSQDAAVMDIFGALLNGASLYPIDLREKEISHAREWLIKQEITIYHSTPTVYRYFTNSLDGEQKFTKLRLIVLGGEETYKRDVDLYKKYFSPQCVFVNGLGPTESTVTLQYFIDKQTAIIRNNVPVGYPVDDTEVLLLNEAGEETEVYGEIAIRSPHVALGYWRSPELTKEVFSCDPKNRNMRIYRTGDMGRLTAEGCIEFAGRKDFQVKIRGFRVEPGEVEAVLNDFPSVQKSVVTAQQNADGDKRLLAYVIPQGQKEFKLNELRDYLREKLPEYMLPSSFVTLGSFPLTPSGKIDKAKLPAPEETRSAGEKDYVGPRDELESRLIRIWEKTLGVKPIGIRDNFFDLGGHSLLAVKLFSQLEKLNGKNLTLATLFQAPTIEKLVHVLHESGWKPPWSSLVPIQPKGSRPPLYCVHAVGGNIVSYDNLARHLGTDQPFYGLQAQGLDGIAPVHNRIEDMAFHYINEIRSFQPDGPYYLAGASFGGLVAIEIARRLEAAGQQVALLALFDTHLPLRRLIPIPIRFLNRVKYQEKRIRFYLNDFRLIEPENRLRFIRKMFGRMVRRFRQKIKTFFLPRKIRKVQAASRKALRNYVPQAYHGNITLFRATNRSFGIKPEPTLGWGKFVTGKLDIVEIPGRHWLVEEPAVQILAQKLTACLNEAQKQESRHNPALSHRDVTFS